MYISQEKSTNHTVVRTNITIVYHLFECVLVKSISNVMWHGCAASNVRPE